MIHVNPVASDGQFTIGFDADGSAGMWPGNMADAIPSVDFGRQEVGAEFSDGSDTWTAVENGDEIAWECGLVWIDADSARRAGGDI